MLAMVWIVLAPLLLLGAVCAEGWLRRRDARRLETMLVALRPLGETIDHPTYSAIPERAPMPPASALPFWQSVHALTQWPVLAHVMQVETRRFLIQAKQATDAGNQAGALVYVGAAWHASQLAIMPQAKVNEAINTLKAQEIEKKIQDSLGRENGQEKKGRFAHVR